mmetsp:Transcript_24919/g.69804  ORF Transcript_24919/g.69804 Transcript_24919/m.69804 type:complete len:290 (+) Transcript_24919:100-969(+)
MFPTKLITLGILSSPFCFPSSSRPDRCNSSSRKVMYMSQVTLTASHPRGGRERVPIFPFPATCPGWSSRGSSSGGRPPMLGILSVASDWDSFLASLKLSTVSPLCVFTRTKVSERFIVTISMAFSRALSRSSRASSPPNSSGLSFTNASAVSFPSNSDWRSSPFCRRFDSSTRACCKYAFSYGPLCSFFSAASSSSATWRRDFFASADSAAAASPPPNAPSSRRTKRSSGLQSSTLVPSLVTDTTAFEGDIAVAIALVVGAAAVVPPVLEDKAVDCGVGLDTVPSPFLG